MSVLVTIPTSGAPKVWCARIAGTDPKFGFRREFVRWVEGGSKTATYSLDQGVWELRGCVHRWVAVVDNQVTDLALQEVQELVAKPITATRLRRAARAAQERLERQRLERERQEAELARLRQLLAKALRVLSQDPEQVEHLDVMRQNKALDPKGTPSIEITRAKLDEAIAALERGEPSPGVNAPAGQSWHRLLNVNWAVQRLYLVGLDATDEVTRVVRAVLGEDA